MTTRGIRNCNPGNIRNSKTKYLGEVRSSRDAAFKQFETMAWGYRAMFVLLYTYSRNGYRTLRQMEEKGLIEKLDTDEYQITAEGRICLKTWKWTLREYADNIRALADEIDA